MKIRNLFVIAWLALAMISCKQSQPVPAETLETAPVADTSQKMITAKVFLKSEFVDDFVQAARAMIDSSNAEPGCISYMLYQNPYDNTQLIFVETWKNQAAIDAHFNMSYFKAFGPKTAEWISQPTELKIYDIMLQQ